MKEVPYTCLREDEQTEPAKDEVNRDAAIEVKNAQTFVPVSLKLQ